MLTKKKPRHKYVVTVSVETKDKVTKAALREYVAAAVTRSRGELYSTDGWLTAAIKARVRAVDFD